MVDFNSEATVSTSASEVEKILILQRRDTFIDKVQAAKCIDCQGGQVDTSRMKSALYALFMQVQAPLKRHMNNGSFEKFDSSLKSEKFEDILEAFFVINEWLDRVKLTRIDNKKNYDKTNIEVENAAKSI